MPKKIQIVFSYIILFLESILFFAITALTILNTTILNDNYVINRLNKTDYYQKLYQSIKTEMTYYTGQSGFDDNILDDTFTVDEIKKDTNNYLKNLYFGKKSKIDTTDFEKRLNKKIDDYLEEENFTITNYEEIDKFTKEMVKIYVKRIKIISYLDNIGSKFKTFINLSHKLLLIFLITLMVLIFLNMFLFKRKSFSILLYTSTFLLIASNIYFRSRIDLNNVFFYNEQLSHILIMNIKSILLMIIIIAIIYLIIGIIIDLLSTIKKYKKISN